MIIKTLSLENIRSHQQFFQQFSPTVTVVTGVNGSGKTSLIEAILIALSGKSFKGTDKELLRKNADWWRIDVTLDDQLRTIKFQPEAGNKKKQFIVDDKTTIRIPVSAVYPTVLFEPDDLRLLHGSPSRRRQFIDRFAAQLIPEYGRVLRRYDRALLQRNRLLKHAASDDNLFAWNVSLAKYGAQIIDTRVRLVERLNSQLNTIYDTIAQTSDLVSIHYSHTMIDNTEHKLLGELEARSNHDRVLGFTSVGPHRHDILFVFNDTPAINAASRGEVRTIVLALKFLEVAIIEQVTDLKPIVLLDDVFSELDEQRQTHLATNFQDHQIIMTSTNAPSTLKKAAVIHLT